MLHRFDKLLTAFSHSFRSTAFVIVLAFLLTSIVFTQANAAEVTISGYTNGCVDSGCTAPNTSSLQTAILLGLTYVNSNFSGTSSSGFLGLGGNPQPLPSQNLNNLGAFSLNGSSNTYTGNTFTLRVTFTAPTGIAGSNTTTFSADLTGSVASAGNGGVLINFNNTPLLFTFNNGINSGSFTLAVNDLAINPGKTSAITGQITGATSSPVALTSTENLFRSTEAAEGIFSKSGFPFFQFSSRGV